MAKTHPRWRREVPRRLLGHRGAVQRCESRRPPVRRRRCPATAAPALKLTRKFPNSSLDGLALRTYKVTRSPAQARRQIASAPLALWRVHAGRKTDSAHSSHRWLGARANSRRLGPRAGLRARRAGSHHMRCGVEFHRRLHRRPCRPARTGSTTPPTGGLRATTRRPTTAAAARDSRGRPTAPAPAARAAGTGARHRHRRRTGDRHGLGERPALQPVQGRHHQHELEHRPDAVGRGRDRPAGGGLRQPGVAVRPEAARDHARVRYRSLRQRDLGRCLGCQLGGRERSATPEPPA